MTKEEQIKLLKDQLDYHDNLYYNNDAPEITDVEYDALKEQYLKLTGEDEYDFVPGDAKFSKVTHTYPIRSLAKVNNADDLRREMQRLWPVVIEPKFDGLTLVNYPEQKIVTRGNGTIGEDVTSNAININGLGVLGNPIRGEAIIPIPVFETLNEERVANGDEPFKNPRNAVAGMLRNKDASKVKGVEFFAYNVLGIAETESTQVDILKEWGWQITPVWTFSSVDEAVGFVVNFNRKSLPYEIDGMVIKSDIPDSLAVFGETGHHPKNAVAYKFPAEGRWTTLRSVTWQVGRTGKLTPVAEIDPVDIGGSTISRVTLHNEGIMKALGIVNKCEVFVIKANDVIPAITQARHDGPYTEYPVEIPTSCPDCGGAVRVEKDQRFCDNLECPSKAINRLVFLAARDALNIEGLSEETATKMFEQKLIAEPFDIFHLTVNDIKKLEGFAQKSAEKLYNAIQGARRTELKRFLYCVGISGVGRSTSEDIARTFRTWDQIVIDGENNLKRMRAIEGIGTKTIENIINYGYLWADLLQYVEPLPMVVNETTVAPGEVKTFVLTGTVDKPRSYYENMIKNAGHKVSGSVSKKTSYVIVGEDAGEKANKAKELNIPMIESNWEEEIKKVL